MDKQVCSLCGGSGWRTVLQDGKEKAARCTCREHEREIAIAQEASIPERYVEADFSQYDMQGWTGKAVERCAHWARHYPDNNPPGLWITGNVGVGKTHLACATLRGVVQRGYSGLFLTYFDFLESLRVNYRRKEETNQYAAAARVDVLLLDDLGSERQPPEWVQEIVAGLVDSRYNRRKAMLVTTVFPKESLIEQFGERTHSKLMELCQTVQMMGVDRRKKASGQ